MWTAIAAAAALFTAVAAIATMVINIHTERASAQRAESAAALSDGSAQRVVDAPEVIANPENELRNE